MSIKHYAACALRAVAVAAALAAGSIAASAADYPTKPISIVVPFPAGGGVDAMARVVAAKLTVALGERVIVDNRPGAGGTLGTKHVARAEADGYTLLLGHSGTVAINPSLYVNAGIDPRKDFAPIGLVAAMPVALLAHPSFPAKSITDFIKLAKEKPGKLNLGSSAVGTGGYMCSEMFKSEAGIDVAIIPYKGTAPVMNDLLGGHIPVAIGVLPPALGNIHAGKLRAIAVTSKERFAGLPDVPTFSESGMPGFEAQLYYGLLAPAGTPKAIVDRLSAELRKLVVTDEVKERIVNEGGAPLVSTAEEYAAAIDKDEKRWSTLVHKLGLKVK